MQIPPRWRPCSVGAWSWLLTFIACQPPMGAPAESPSALPSAPSSAGVSTSVADAPSRPARPARPSILSAHLSRADDPELSGQDGILVVFSVELDAAAMRPRAFVVSRSDGASAWPTRAIFAPASEGDENRSIMLVGEFGGAEAAHQPTHVAVNGPLFAEDGARLSSLGAAVTPFSTPPSVVAFQRLAAGPGRCEGSAQLLRTYWSDALRGVEPEDLARVRVQSSGPEPVHPRAFDDHELAHDEAGQDNVLDLCMAEAGPVHQLWVDAGTFRDVAGHPSAAIDLRLDVSGA